MRARSKESYKPLTVERPVVKRPTAMSLLGYRESGAEMSQANLETLDSELVGRLRRLSHIALDMDGTIYNGDTLLPCTRPFLERVRRLGISYSFVTNNPSKGVEDYLKKLRRMGLTVDADQLYTSAMATVDYLRREHPEVRRLFVLGTPSMMDEFASAGFTFSTDDHADEPDAVVIGFDLTLDYAKVCRAAWWMTHGKLCVATNPDRVCPTDQPTVLVDCGAICAMLESATGVVPDKVLGKPDPDMLRGIIERLSIRTSQIAMVGDRLYTDIQMAERAGALGVLVLTGECTRRDVESADHAPDLVVPSLAEFGDLLNWAKNGNRA